MSDGTPSLTILQLEKRFRGQNYLDLDLLILRIGKGFGGSKGVDPKSSENVIVILLYFCFVRLGHGFVHRFANEFTYTAF